MATLSSSMAYFDWRHWFRAAVCVAVLTCPLSLQATLALSPEDAETADSMVSFDGGAHGGIAVLVAG